MEKGEAIALSDVVFAWEKDERSFSMRLPSFSVGRGERLCLIGESGSGKSTLLGLICGSLVPESGSVVVFDTVINELGGPARDRYRAENIGVIFQQFNLLPYLSVLENVLLPLQFSAKRRSNAGNTAAERHDAALALLHGLGMSADTHGQKAARLSVGQQQRVAAARAFIGAPPLIIADEPTSALDEGRRDDFLDLLVTQADATGATLLMVSHDPRVATHFDRIVRLGDVLQERGT